MAFAAALGNLAALQTDAAEAHDIIEIADDQIRTDRFAVIGDAVPIFVRVATIRGQIAITIAAPKLPREAVGDVTLVGYAVAVAVRFALVRDEIAVAVAALPTGLQASRCADHVADVVDAVFVTVHRRE